MPAYRACYYTTPDGQSSTVLTLPEHAHLSDDDLRREAEATAERARLVGDEWPCVTPDALRAGLTIGEWTDA